MFWFAVPYLFLICHLFCVLIYLLCFNNWFTFCLHCLFCCVALALACFYFVVCDLHAFICSVWLGLCAITSTSSTHVFNYHWCFANCGFWWGLWPPGAGRAFHIVERGLPRRKLKVKTTDRCGCTCDNGLWCDNRAELPYLYVFYVEI